MWNFLEIFFQGHHPGFFIYLFFITTLKDIKVSNAKLITAFGDSHHEVIDIFK